MCTEVLLDVSELEPPEPLALALEATEQLRAGQYLRMTHRREPCMLFADLEENDFKYFQRKGATAAVEVFIWAKDDAVAEMAVQAIINKPT